MVMNIIIIGCGRVGSRLAKSLDEWGYDVSVIDRDPQQLELLGDDFGGLVVRGISIDKDVLTNAGCENADAVVVVTPNDNMNIMTTHMIREYFGVETVYTRIMEPELEEVYQNLGFQTICSTRLVSDAIFEHLTEADADIKAVNFGTEFAHFIMRHADKYSILKAPSKIPLKPGEMLFAVKKKSGKIVLANNPKLNIENSDVLIVASVQDEGGIQR